MSLVFFYLIKKVIKLYFPCPVCERRGVCECERAQSAHAEEACDVGELPAGGGGGTCEGAAGGSLSGRTHHHRAHPAAPEPTAALRQPVGRRPGARVSVPWTW